MISLFGLDSLRRRWRWAVISRSWRLDPEHRSVMAALKPHVGFAGDGTATGTRLLKAEARVRRFGGYDVVTAADAVAIVSEVLDPGSLGLEKIRERTWVGPGGEDRFRTLTLVPMKGAYQLRWGVSLSYVPHSWTPRPQFHRTAEVSSS